MDAHVKVVSALHIMPLGCPHVAAEPVCFRASGEQRRDLRPLLRTEPCSHAGRWPTRQRLHAALLTGTFEPLAHGSFPDAQRGGDVLLQPTLLFQDPGALPPLFAPVGLRWCSHVASLPRL